MNKIKETLHEKRQATEKHIKQLRKNGKKEVRYTAMIPDIPFLILGLLSDVGWIIHIVAGIVYLCRNGFHRAADYMAVVALAAVIFGVVYISYLNKIHEKEIATRRQKNLSFGVTAFSGLAGAVIGIFQLAAHTGVSSELVCVVVGGFLNFVSTLPIYLSFKKGVFYGVQ